MVEAISFPKISPTSTFYVPTLAATIPSVSCECASTSGYGKGIQKTLIDEEPSVQLLWHVCEHWQKTGITIGIGDELKLKIHDLIQISDQIVNPFLLWKLPVADQPSIPRICACTPSLGVALHRGPINTLKIKWRQESRLLTVKFSLSCQALNLGVPRTVISQKIHHPGIASSVILR